MRYNKKNIFFIQPDHTLIHYTGEAVELENFAYLPNPLVNLSDEQVERFKEYEYPVWDYKSNDVVDMSEESNSRKILEQAKLIEEQDKTITTLNTRIDDLTEVASGLSETIIESAMEEE